MPAALVDWSLQVLVKLHHPGGAAERVEGVRARGTPITARRHQPPRFQNENLAPALPCHCRAPLAPLMSSTAQTGHVEDSTISSAAAPDHADAFKEIGSLVHEGLSELKSQLKQARRPSLLWRCTQHLQGTPDMHAGLPF